VTNGYVLFQLLSANSTWTGPTFLPSIAINMNSTLFCGLWFCRWRKWRSEMWPNSWDREIWKNTCCYLINVKACCTLNRELYAILSSNHPCQGDVVSPACVTLRPDITALALPSYNCPHLQSAQHSSPPPPPTPFSPISHGLRETFH
jgi:hypothetical protein